MVPRNGCPFVLGDYPRAVFRKSSSIAISGEIPTGLTAGASIFLARGFGVVIAFASSESASNHFSRVAFGAFGACVVDAFGACSFAISEPISRNEPSATSMPESWLSESTLSDNARSEEEAMRNLALGVPSFVSADSRRLTRDFAVSDSNGKRDTMFAISFLFIF